MATRCIPRRPGAGPLTPAAVQPVQLELPALTAPAGTAAARGLGNLVASALAVYSATGQRPAWLSDQVLNLLEAQGRLPGIVYLLHFDHPIGDTSNPRGYARHYTGWTLALNSRLAKHAAGSGARLMEVITQRGIGWQLARVWRDDRWRERSLKRSGGAARRCPLCKLTALGLVISAPAAEALAIELGDRVARALTTPAPAPAPVAPSTPGLKPAAPKEAVHDVARRAA